MTAFRLEAPAGNAIDRQREIAFKFNGRALKGFAGDTLASALLANGQRLIGRSFKYHRPRGIVSCGVEEPTGLVDISDGAARVPNTRATDVALSPGLVARTGNAWPTVRFDVGATSCLFASVLTAGFYYKTFMWPSWHLFEPAIRRAAGLGHAGEGPDPDRYDELSISTEVLVVGAGLAGLEAGVSAAEHGAHVTVIESDAWAGGWAATVGAGTSRPALEMRRRVVSLLDRAARAGVRLRLGATVFGLYDHGLAVAAESGEGDLRERTLRIRAGRIILATGAFDRPLLFPDNDRPGVMFAHGAERYAAHYGVAVGRRVVVASACDAGLELAQRLRSLGVAVAATLDLRRGEHVVGVRGRNQVTGVLVASTRNAKPWEIEADTLLHTGGFTPNVGLHSQAGGGLRWHDESSMFVPSRLARDVEVVGACAGVFDLDASLEHAHLAGLGRAGSAPVGGAGAIPSVNAPPPQLRRKRTGKTFVDLQNDVCDTDIALAARENYRSVEHLKRYTTTGMATDQGKTSNVNALVTMGTLTNRSPGEVGTTKFRPPYKPVTLGAIVAGRSGERYRPLKRMPAHAFHESCGASFEEFSGWLRPAAYPRAGESLEAAAQREAAHTRAHVSLFEGSPLGKIEIYGPDAAAFLDLMYVGTMSTLAVGSARYGLLLNENGIVIDDGIVARIGAEHFWLNTTSSGAERAALAFEEWLQCEFVTLRVIVQPVASQWGNVTVAGPKAWQLLEAVGFDTALAPALMKHMTMRQVSYAGVAMRVMRASFSGELGYEINVPALHTKALIERLWQTGRSAGLDVGLYGVEALMLMRLEKGFIHVGVDTDGTTLPQDIGMARGLDKKSAHFVGRRSLLRAAGTDPDRMQLVGLVPTDGSSRLPVGAHIVAHRPPAPIDGFVTSSGYSLMLQQPVALAMLRHGSARLGERLRIHHLETEIEAQVVKTPFFDPAGERLHG
ncbi:2Fe-2S iron-sulfur cluster-binding protein [Roseateles sp. NT4]|uniref:2Fe-2S iron-sulfur cluster-binding protein n=1 Tax=Roseateles sp. NT4 TaxID=3453715 RepID=UPI003EEB93D7